MNKKILHTALILASAATSVFSAEPALWSHLKNADALVNTGTESFFSEENGVRVLNLKQVEKGRYAWVSIPAPVDGWGLANAKNIEAEILNTGSAPVEVMLWAVPDFGWDAIGKRVEIQAGQSVPFCVALRSTYKDKTPKLDPNRVQRIEVMFSKASVGASLQVRGLMQSGTKPDWVIPADRMIVPNMEDAPFAAGKRVRYQLPEHRNTDIYSVLYLPETWTPQGKYPVIVEFPGNIYYTGSVYSTGRPEQCSIGYGMSKNAEAIWVSVPFVDYEQSANIENGWGSADDTADYTVKLVRNIIDTLGGDKENVVITGFSRGAIACGFIGRRNDEVAALWKGEHSCQHYDGDGWGGADLAGARERARRIGTRPIFHTDNEGHADLDALLSDVAADVTHARSGLGAHATAMFLDDRPSTLQLRDWYKKLLQENNDEK